MIEMHNISVVTGARIGRRPKITESNRILATEMTLHGWLSNNRNRVFRGHVTSSIISTNQSLVSQNIFITLLYTTRLPYVQGVLYNFISTHSPVKNGQDSWGIQY